VRGEGWRRGFFFSPLLFLPLSQPDTLPSALLLECKIAAIMDMDCICPVSLNKNTFNAGWKITASIKQQVKTWLF